MLRKFYDTLASLNFGLRLMAGVTLLLAIGSFVLGPEESARLNSMPLLVWLIKAPLVVGWWLWLSIALLALLGLNTVLCSMQSLCRKGGRAGLLLRLAPHAMHAGFLLIALAHLVSSVGGFKEGVEVGEGMVIDLTQGRVLIERLDAQVGIQGYVTDFSATVMDSHGRRGIIRPNEPFFSQGLGLYLKQVELYPKKLGIMEIHREPGAGLALAGALLFIVGNVVVVARKKEKES